MVIGVIEFSLCVVIAIFEIFVPSIEEQKRRTSARTSNIGYEPVWRRDVKNLQTRQLPMWTLMTGCFMTSIQPWPVVV